MNSRSETREGPLCDHTHQWSASTELSTKESDKVQKHEQSSTNPRMRTGSWTTSSGVQTKHKNKNNINSRPQSQVLYEDWELDHLFRSLSMTIGAPQQFSVLDTKIRQTWTVVREPERGLTIGAHQQSSRLKKATRYKNMNSHPQIRPEARPPLQVFRLSTKIRTNMSSRSQGQIWGWNLDHLFWRNLSVTIGAPSTVLRSNHKNNISSRLRSQGWGPEAGPPLQVSLYDHRRFSTVLRSKNKDKNISKGTGSWITSSGFSLWP